MQNNLAEIILEPVITEKSTALSQFNKYTFKVVNSADKITIKKAFEKVFPNRKVKSVQISKIFSHKRRTKGGYVKNPSCKKAIITIDGPKIDYFPEVS